jgi:calcyclin binding protein
MELDGIGEIPKENVEVTFGERSFEMKAHGVHGKNYRFSIVDLANKIIPSASTMKLRPKRAIFSLKKASSTNWSSLQQKEEKVFPDHRSAPVLTYIVV